MKNALLVGEHLITYMYNQRYFKHHPSFGASFFFVSALYHVEYLYDYFFFRPPKLRAEQFVPGNQEHVNILKAMGITVVQTKDGRIKLMQTASTVRVKW